MICSRRKEKNKGSMNLSWFTDKSEILRQIGKVDGDPIVYFYDGGVYDLGIDASQCPYDFVKQNEQYEKWCEEETRRVYL